MVESQRDLLLRTVVELQQRSNLQTGALPPDVNKVLQELNIRVDHSKDISDSLPQDSPPLQTYSEAIAIPETHSVAPQLDFADLEKFPWAGIR